MSLSTNRVTHVSAHFNLLAVGKLDLPFGFRRHAIASRRAVSPRAHRLQNSAVAGQAGTLQNQRAVHTSVGADDKADSDLLSAGERRKNGIGCGECLRRTNVFALRPSHMWNIDKLLGTRKSAQDFRFALLECSARRTGRGCAESWGNERRRRQQYCWPDAAKHSVHGSYSLSMSRLRSGIIPATSGPTRIEANPLFCNSLPRQKQGSARALVKLLAHGQHAVAISEVLTKKKAEPSAPPFSTMCSSITACTRCIDS